VGTGAWVVCFWWMHRISARQDALLTELRELAQTQQDIWREVHPDVGEIKAHVVEEQGAKINEISEQVTQMADTVTSPETSATAGLAPSTRPVRLGGGMGARDRVARADPHLGKAACSCDLRCRARPGAQLDQRLLKHPHALAVVARRQGSGGLHQVGAVGVRPLARCLTPLRNPSTLAPMSLYTRC
jgi:hypothetical protein